MNLSAKNASQTLSVGRQVFMWLMFGLLTRIIIDELFYLGGLGHYALFNPNSDIFADSIKQSLLLHSVSFPLLHSDKVFLWPVIFRNYAFFNPPLGPEITVYSQPPLAVLQLMLVAKIIVISSPYFALFIEFSFYIFGLFIVTKFFELTTKKKDYSVYFIFFSMILSYSFLYMFDRGNFTAGYAAVCVTIYVLSVYTNSWRFFGAIAMAYAVNVRPNILVIALIEFAIDPDFWRAIRPLAVIAILSLLTLGFATAITHWIDPNYSLTVFIKAYSVFRYVFIVNDLNSIFPYAGLGWSASLYGAVRCVWALFGISPSYNPKMATLISYFGFCSVIVYIWLSILRKLSKSEAVFLAISICMLFTPFNAEYHVTKFLAPVLVIAYDLERRSATVDISQIWQPMTLLLMLGFIAWVFPNGCMAILLILGSVLASVSIWKTDQSRYGLARTEGLIIITCILVLCPLGSPLSNSIEIVSLIVAANCLIMGDCLWRPSRVDISNVTQHL